MSEAVADGLRIAYWSNSCLEPNIEAVSKEIRALTQNFYSASHLSLNPNLRLRCSLRDREFGLHPKMDPLVRLVVPFLESRCDVNHVYATDIPWTFQKMLGRRPIVLTICSDRAPQDKTFLDRCQKILVQTESLFDELVDLGYGDRTELAYPGVDLNSFRPSPAEKKLGRPKVLFATAPRTAEEMKERGVDLLVNAAAQDAEIQYRFLYRKWRGGYTSLAATEALLAEHRVSNVDLTNSVISKMSNVYWECDFTVVPYQDRHGGKACPNSIVEGMACGLPVLVSAVAPLANFVQEHRCGIVFDPQPDCLVNSIREGMRRYHELSRNAIRVANDHFSEQTLLSRICEIYRAVTA